MNFWQTRNEHQRFIKITIALLLTMCIVWIFLLSPAYQDIRNYRNKTRNLQEALHALYQNTTPEQETLLIMLQQNREITEKFTKIKSATSIETIGETNTSPVDFRRLLEEKISLLRQHASQLGIAFDSKLGFDRENNQVRPYHFLQLHLADYLSESIFTVLKKNPRTHCQWDFVQPQIEETTNEKQFLTTYQIEISLTTSFSILQQFIQQHSMPISATNKYFLSLQKVEIEAADQEITARILFSALFIDEQAPFTSEPTSPNREQTPVSKPIWERF